MERYNRGVDITSIVTALRIRLADVLAAPRARYRPLVVDDEEVGWVDDGRAGRLAAFTDVFIVDEGRITFVRALLEPSERTLAVERVARALSEERLLTAWRNERYAVTGEFGKPPRFELERAAARYFGIHTYAAHLNGLARRDGAAYMWLARRSPRKAIDPGLLDNLVGGGIAAGASVPAALAKEAGEEAGISEADAAQARPHGTVHVCREQPDGLQRETIFVHDLWLDADFLPMCQDGEVVDYRLATLPDAASLAANREGPDVVTADASLVIVDCLIRHDVIAKDSPDYPPLSALRYPLLEPAGMARTPLTRP
jgi:8-oxo-dGTP pyrophosphatase MutT (NUDIX family)